MKLKIESTDRIGISQEILAQFASQAWNVKSTEVASEFTYVHLDSGEITIGNVRALLANVPGIKHCQQVAEMPAEQREKHIQALLAKISDPILDIDHHGQILACNKAASLVAGDNILSGENISQFIDLSINELLQPNEFSIAIEFCGKPYIADINPVVSQNQVTGAVVYLKTVQKVGRQLSLVQSGQDDALQSIIGSSEKIKLIIAQINRFSQLDLPVLIAGETGTGKELVARALHQLSPRKDNPFLTINCAAIPEQLLESELFGYESGAFTGANKRGKPGLFELADGGTVFLDEIAEMSNYLQAKLLRFLQDYRYRKVGGTKELTANVKIISASHQNFTALIKERQFREDLYYRINVLKLELPPLYERKEDIELLALHFLHKAAKQVDQAEPKLSAEGLDLLCHYHWPGNVRQLENAVFKLIAISDDGHISAKQVNQVLFGSLSDSPEQQLDSRIANWAQAQAEFEKQLLQQLYPLYPTTRKLAERLNVSHNKIAMKLRAHNIS